MEDQYQIRKKFAKENLQPNTPTKYMILKTIFSHGNT